MSNLFNQFNEIFDKKERGIATVTAVYGNQKIIAQTESGAAIILRQTAQGQAQTGDKVYYDKRSLNILGKAPNVPFYEYEV